MNLREMRLKKGMSQNQLSNLAGVNLRTLQAYEQGLKNIDGAKLKTLISLSAALECKVSDILNDGELREECRFAGL